jgi:hypothetical protein
MRTVFVCNVAQNDEQGLPLPKMRFREEPDPPVKQQPAAPRKPTTNVGETPLPLPKTRWTDGRA